MGVIRFSQFRGELTPENRRTKENVYATCAINTNLHAGSLKPFPCPELVCSHAFVPRALWSMPDCDCVAWDNDSFIAQDKNFIYWKENGQRARKSPKDCFCDDTTYWIGVPCPLTAPSASGSGSGCDFDPRTYYYSYVAKYCGGCEAEGPLSPPSNSVTCGGSASVGSFSSPPGGYGITHIRIYRSVAGWKSGEENASKNTGGMLLVGEIPTGQGFTDTTSLSSLGMISPITYDTESMPSTPEGLGMTAFGLFVWEGKNLYISVDGLPDVYRESGHFCFDHNILAAQYWNGSIYVFTEKWNYRIDEQAAEGGAAYSNPPFRFESLAPIANLYSISVGATGVFYSSSSGVGVLSGSNSIILGFVSTDQWKSMSPENIKTHVYQQYLFVYNPDWDHAHILEIDDSIYQSIEYSKHIRYPYSISAMYTTDDGKLRFSEDTDVYEFVEEQCYNVTDCAAHPDLCGDCCPYDYRIDTRDVAELGDFSAAYLSINPYYGQVTFELWEGDYGNRLLFSKTITGGGDHEFKLPGCGPLSAHHTLRLYGCAEVYGQSRIGTNAKQMGGNTQ